MNAPRRLLRTAWDEACTVAAGLAAQRRPPVSPTLPRAAWAEAERWAERLQLALRREWPAAARYAAARLADARRTLSDQLAAWSGEDLLSLPRPSPGELVRDLAALREEWDEVFLDGDELVVVIPPVEFDGIALGPFQVRLAVANVAAHALPVRVVALEPRPAWSNADVTHPHVSNEGLCAGDGLVPLQRALADGRLLDAFTIAARVLATYNPESAYVALADWDGVPCADCADLVDRDDLQSCGSCGAELCSACGDRCGVCRDVACGACAERCPACDRPCCASCRRACDGCHASLCEECLDEHDRCPACVAACDDPVDSAAPPDDESDETDDAPPGAKSLAGPTGPPLRP